MRVILYRSMDGAQPTSGSWGPYSLPQNIAGSGSATFEMYSRPSAFGPPVAVSENEGGSPKYRITGSNEFGPEQGVYASHTPPYYDGSSYIDLIYYPAEYSGSTTYGSNTTDGSFKPTLEDLHTMAPIGKKGGSGYSYNGNTARFGATGMYMRKWRFDQMALFNVIHSNGSRETSWNSNEREGTSGSVGPMAGPFANEWCMHGDASLNLFSKDANGRWKIQTKFETPMLNFNYLTEDLLTSSSAGTDPDPLNRSVNSTIPRGMWHQFGRLPQDDEGVFMQVTDIPDDFLDHHPSSSILYDPIGRFHIDNQFSHTAQLDTLTEINAAGVTWEKALSGYRFPKDFIGVGEDSQQGAETVMSPKPKSLIDICGFSTEPVRIGKVRQKNKIWEAVVAVPFLVIDGERKFFSLADHKSALFNSSVGPSVKRQIRLMNKYVFPPSMDFVNNHGEVEPIAMYIFEFSHTFDSDDLSHMWQNLPPKLGTRAMNATATVKHKLLNSELLGDISSRITDTAQGLEPHHIRFPKELQWMVFKVKQRAKRDYFELVKDTMSVTETKVVAKHRDGTEETETITTEVPYESSLPFYSYNWPYDYFSIVELAKLEVGVTFGETIPEPKPAKVSRTPAGSALTAESAVVQSAPTSPGSPAASGFVKGSK